MKQRREKGAGPKCWGSGVYDYERWEIVDAAAAEVDLQEGWWIRCKCCRERKYKMRDPFDIQRWIKHKGTKTHLTGAMKHGIYGLDSKPQQQRTVSSRARKISRRSLRVRLKVHPNGEYAAHPQHPHRRSKNNVATNGAMLNTVVHSLVTLVSEQQDDINALRASMKMVREQTKRLASELAHFTSMQQDASQSVRCYSQNRAPESPLCRRSNGSSCESQNEESRGYDTDDTDKSFTDMSIFEDQSQLVEMDWQRAVNEM